MPGEFWYKILSSLLVICVYEKEKEGTITVLNLQKWLEWGGYAYAYIVRME